MLRRASRCCRPHVGGGCGVASGPCASAPFAFFFPSPPPPPTRSRTRSASGFFPSFPFFSFSTGVFRKHYVHFFCVIIPYVMILTAFCVMPYCVIFLLICVIFACVILSTSGFHPLIRYFACLSLIVTLPAASATGSLPPSRFCLSVFVLCFVALLFLCLRELYCFWEVTFPCA